MVDSGNIEYDLIGRPAFAYANVTLKRGQQFFADSNALLWLDSAIAVHTGMAGDPCSSCYRRLSQEPCCLNRFENDSGNEPKDLALGFELPGDIMAFGVDDKTSWIFTTSAFVGCSENVTVTSRFAGCFACCCADEGPWLTACKIRRNSQDPGIVFAGGYGTLSRHTIAKGEQLFVAAGLFFAAEYSQSFKCECLGQECCGLKNFCCSGSSVVLEFQGPCTVYTQSRNDYALRRLFAPREAGGEGGSGQDAGDIGAGTSYE